MKRSDILAGIIIGTVSGFLALFVLRNIKVELPEFFGWLLPLVLPVLSVAGLFIADFLGKKFKVLWQAAKFALVGALNTLIDLSVLNLLIFLSGTATGFWFSAFKAASFVTATINSYLWNKYWTFAKRGEVKAGEFTQFFLVATIGLVINVSAASFIVNVIGVQFGLSERIWANLGALAAVFFGMVWNFLGFKLIVFKR